MSESKYTMGIAVSPVTGNKVLAVRKNTKETVIFHRTVKEIDGTDDSGFVQFQGEKGEVLNYVTLELYGNVGLVSEITPKGIRPVSDNTDKEEK